MAYTDKQKFYFYKNSFDAGKTKDESKKIFTKNNFVDIYSSLRECWLANKEYSQVSTGRNHEERGVVIVDDDERNIDQALKNFRLLKFPLPNIIIENPQSHHTQSYYFLKEPVVIKTGWLKNNKFSTTQTKEYQKYKEVNDMMNFLAGDPNFTCWRCKNPFNDTFETIECRDEYFTIDELYDSVKQAYDLTLLINEGFVFDEDEKVSKKPSKINKINMINKCHTSYETTKNGTTWIKTEIGNIEVGYKKGCTSRNILTRDIARSVFFNNPKCSESDLIKFMLDNKNEVAALISETPLSNDEIERTAKSAFNYCSANYNKENNFYSQKQKEFAVNIRKAKKLINIIKISKDSNLNNTELSAKYKVSRRTIIRYKEDLKNVNEMNSLRNASKVLINQIENNTNIKNENLLYILENKNLIK